MKSELSSSMNCIWGTCLGTFVKVSPLPDPLRPSHTKWKRKRKRSKNKLKRAKAKPQTSKKILLSRSLSLGVSRLLELSTLWHTRYILRFFTLLYHLTCTSVSRDSWHKGALPVDQQYNKRCVHPPPPCVKKRLESVSVSASVSVFYWLRKVFCNHYGNLNGNGRPSVTIKTFVPAYMNGYRRSSVTIQISIICEEWLQKTFRNRWNTETDAETEPDSGRFWNQPPPPNKQTNTRLKHATDPALFNFRSLGKGWRVRKRGVLFKLCPGVSRHTQHTCHARESAQTQRFLFPADRRLSLAVKYRVYPLVRAY